MSNIDAILAKAVAGERLRFEDGVALYASDEVEKIGAAANQVMLRFHPEPIATFVVGRNINYTNVCDVYCRFCAFYREAKDADSYVLSTEKVLEKIQELVDVDGTEVLMQGGVNPNLPFTYYLELLRDIKKHFPNIHMHSFSTIEARKMLELSGLSSYEEVFKQLKEAGLDSLPGAGAEMLVDRVRSKISRLKGSADEWIETMKAAQRSGLHTTATMVIGFGETDAERIEHMLRIRDAQDVCLNEKYPSRGHLAFIVWTFQPDNTNMKAERVQPREYLKTLAIARLMLDNIPNFQSSWVTMGAEVGKQSLHYGCNDFGSTMMEENVVSAAACTHKVNTNLILDMIREAGKIPAQRNTKYEILRVFKDGESVERDFVLQNDGQENRAQ
jgi:cyclic dehypoxanthinyl futalosine synthase